MSKSDDSGWGISTLPLQSLYCTEQSMGLCCHITCLFPAVSSSSPGTWWGLKEHCEIECVTSSPESASCLPARVWLRLHSCLSCQLLLPHYGSHENLPSNAPESIRTEFLKSNSGDLLSILDSWGHEFTSKWAHSLQLLRAFVRPDSKQTTHQMG